MIKKMSIFLVLLLCFTLNKAKAEETEVCGDVPLYLGRYTTPDILLIVDLSGSMAYGLRPDWSPVYQRDSDPDTPGDQPYDGFYTQHGLENYVFRRFYRWGDVNDHFLLIPCYESPSSIDSSPLNDWCVHGPGYLSYNPLSPVNPSEVYIDETLRIYGIADWNNSNYPYDNFVFPYVSHRTCDPSTCPPYAEDSPYLPLLYEWDTAVLGNYLNTTRIEVVAGAIKDLAQDSSIALGLGFFKEYFGSSNDYTLVYTGVQPYSDEHVLEIIETIDRIAHESIDDCENCFRINVGGGTPFSPSIVAAKKYFTQQKRDEDGNYYNPRTCSKKFAIFLTDGVGNVDSDVDNVRSRTRALVSAGVTPIAVGFNLPPDEDAQLRVMAEEANQNADGVNTFALHRDYDNDGRPDPFIARNPQELAETLRSIIYEIKQTVFMAGAGTARKTEVGNRIIWTAFDVRDWTGEVRSGHFTYNCANCHTPSNVRNLARWNFYRDVDGDGHLDLVNEDLDGDGRLDTVFEDLDGDGHLDVNEDENGNGILDEGEDVDGDGRLDLVDEDVDGDGHLDVPEDVDGDGHLDSPEEIDWEALQTFLSDSNRIREAMGEEALRGYDSSKVGEIIAILRDPSREADWWAIEEGWSTSSTLTCENSSSRNIKYGSEMEDFVGEIAPLSANQVSFIRGERGCGSSDTEFRTRSKPLGDIIFSQPRVWNDLVWVAANDGMLHAFDIDTGEEEFAYIPESILARYAEVGYWEVGYCHTFLFDGTPVIQEVGDTSFLVVGLGRAGSEYFALDIDGAPSNVRFKWSFNHENLGQAVNPAKLVNCGDFWGAIISSGPPIDGVWENKKAYLFTVDLETGSLRNSIVLGSEGNNMPSVVGVVDINGDHVSDFLYVGDLLGRIWRLRGCNFSASCRLLDFGANYPITSSPVATVSNGKTWVFFGTGKYWDIDDLSDTTSHYLVGFLDDPANCENPTLEEISTELAGDYVLPRNNCQTSLTGWKIRLRAGERVITSPVVVGGVVFFETFVPSGDECSGGGDTWLYALDYNMGCASVPRMDINNDGRVDMNDMIDGKVPLAMKIGEGVPNSPPSIVGSNLLRVTTTNTIRNVVIRTRNVWIKRGSWTDVDEDVLHFN